MLNRKLFRDMKLKKSQFVTIFLMVFLGVFIYTGISSYMEGMKVTAEKYYEKNNFQDIWVLGTGFQNKDVESIKNINNIQHAEPKLTVLGSIEEIQDSTIQLNFIQSNNISKFHVEEGKEFNQNMDGVWIDSYLAKNNYLNVGDKINITYGQYILEKEILGLILVPDHVYDIKSEDQIFPTHTDYGFIYLSDKQFPMGVEYIQYNYILVDIDNISEIENTKNEIRDTLDNCTVVTDRSDDLSSQRYEEEREEGNTYVGIFSGIFLFIAILSVITTMTRIIKEQRVQIGILKALGFKNRKITTLYVSYGFWISLIASILGIIIGPFTIGNFFLSMIQTYYEIPKLSVVIGSSSYVVCFVIILAVSIVTYLSCRKVLREKATDLLRSQTLKIKNTNINLDKGIFKKSNFSTKWNIRDIARSKARTIMGIVGITGCCALIVCAFGLLNTLHDYLDWQFEDLYNFDYKIAMKEDYSEQELNRLISQYGNNTSQTLNIEVISKDKKDMNTITVDNANHLLKYTDVDRNFIELNDDGIYVTSKFAETNNYKLGDSIEWKILDNNFIYTSKIVGINRNPQNQNISTTKEYVESIGLQYRADSIYTNYNLSNVNELEGVDTIQNVEMLKNGMKDMLEIMNLMILLIIIAAILLGIVIIYNLGILSFSEKTYQFATLKVIGFKTKQIRNIFIKQNLWITIISVFIGAPAGYYMTDFIFTMALSDSFDMMAKVNLISYIYGIMGTIIVSLIVNYFLSRKIRTINMVESLKANE